MPENAPNPSIVNQPDFWARYFRQKLEIPTESYRDLTSEEHRWAFAIAGVTNLQLLSDVKKSLTDELEKDEGFTYRDWLTKFDETTKKYGWNPEGWRASLILQQNIRNSFASGRWYQMTDPDLLQQTAAWVWRHRWPENPRLDHLALNGKRYPPGETQFDGQGVPPNSHYHCFPPNTPILLNSDGDTKMIQDLDVGDKILGGSGDIEPVTATHTRQFDGDLTRITIKDGTEIKVTPNHRLLTLRGWIKAGNLKLSDKLIKVTKPIRTATDQGVTDIDNGKQSTNGLMSNPLKREPLPTNALNPQPEIFDKQIDVMSVIRTNDRDLVGDNVPQVSQPLGKHDLIGPGFLPTVSMTSGIPLVGKFESLAMTIFTPRAIPTPFDRFAHLGPFNGIAESNLLPDRHRETVGLTPTFAQPITRTGFSRKVFFTPYGLFDSASGVTIPLECDRVRGGFGEPEVINQPHNGSVTTPPTITKLGNCKITADVQIKQNIPNGFPLTGFYGLDDRVQELNLMDSVFRPLKPVMLEYFVEDINASSPFGGDSFKHPIPLNVESDEGFVDGFPLNFFDSLDDFITDMSNRPDHYESSDIVCLDTHYHTGMVYNLSTPGQSYTLAQGTVHNCHCVLTAELIGEAQELGNPILDPVENTERFAPGQSPEERQETLRAIIDRLPDTIPDGDVQLLRLLAEQIEDYVEEAVDEAIEEYVKESPLTDNEDPDSGDED